MRAEKIQQFTDLSVGDYVVHENHGLGIYKGIEKIEVDRKVKDYIKIDMREAPICIFLQHSLTRSRNMRGKSQENKHQ